MNTLEPGKNGVGEWSDQFTHNKKLYFNLGQITWQFAKPHLTREVSGDGLFCTTLYSTKSIIKRLTIAVDSLLMKKKPLFLDDRGSIKILR